MKPLFKTLIISLLLPALVFAGSDKFKGKYTKEKKRKKEYSVNAGANLKIDNSYGNIDIVSWSENRTVIEVTIKTNGDDEAKVQKKLDEITVEFSGNASQVTAKTLFNEGKNSWSLWGSNKNNISMEINYTVRVPITNSVNLSNDYGAISINKLEGNAQIDCDYGQLIIGELLGENNSINFDYTDKSTISFMNSGAINADYSGFTIEKSNNINLTADYTTSEITSVKKLSYNCDYGKIKIQKAQDITGQGDYLNTYIGTISGSINLNTDYGNIAVDRLTASAKNITINAGYTQVKLGFESGFNFKFKVITSYSGLKGEKNVTITKSTKDGSDKSYYGYYGSKNSENSININSNYGGVTFIKH